MNAYASSVFVIASAMALAAFVGTIADRPIGDAAQQAFYADMAQFQGLTPAAPARAQAAQAPIMVAQNDSGR